MALSPLAVILLAQLALMMLGLIAFQLVQKHRLVKEIEKLKLSRRSAFHGQESASTEGFDRQQAELLLNRTLQNTQTIISEAPAAKALCEDQQALLYTLSDCLNISLDPSKKRSAAAPLVPALHESTDIISQEQIDNALGREEAIEEFDMIDFEGLEGLDDLETSDDNLDFSDSDEDEFKLPEDSVQLALDKMDDFDLSDFEEQLNKIEGK
ncbi:MAG: hypothetical protein GX029_07800 [Pseudomonadaceae bacterium]|nr:hypothetical protein [Pseudomonadaceae bacterium]